MLTGHTGFKGAWMSKVLCDAGAKLTGYALAPQEGDNLFTIALLQSRLNHIEGDVRDLKHLMKVFDETSPEIVIHMAAQPLVRDSYEDPVYTYETNVMGTVNVMECVRLHPCVKSMVNVTTDKVYENKEWAWGYRENEPLDGFDPYSNSKSCSELVTHSYKNSFFADGQTAVSTARAGNAIGGGDFTLSRIVPDCIAAVRDGSAIIVRNVRSTRPYQHVLEPVMAYLMLAAKQYEDKTVAGYYNVGPDDSDCMTTGALVKLFCKHWAQGATWVEKPIEGMPHEATFLKLDCSKIKSVFDWSPCWNIDTAMAKTVEWTKEWIGGGDVNAVMEKQINEYVKRMHHENVEK